MNLIKNVLCVVSMMVFFVGQVMAATLTVKQDGTGDHATIQAAIDAAAEGDEIIISAGTYNEDVSIGDFNAPSTRKDNLTLRSAEGEAVEIVVTNSTARFGGLVAVGNDPGPADLFGMIVHGAGTVLDGLKIVQPSTEQNALGVNAALVIGAPDVVMRNCEIVGSSPDADGDLLGVVVVSIDAGGLLTGNPTIATNVTIDNCRFTNGKFAFANSDFLGTGLPPTVTITNCVFEGNGNGIEIDDGITTVDNSVFRNNGTALHLSDNETFVTNCLIENNIEHGFEIDNQDAEDDDPLDVPKVTIDNCIIRNNGADDTHRGIFMEMGNLILTNSVVAGSTGHNLFFEGEAGRETRVSVDHCDIYNSGAGVAVFAPESAGDIITFTIKNSNIVDQTGIVNETIGLGDFTVEFCNVFTSGEQFVGEFLATTDVLNVDPLFVDADAGNFSLSSSSPVVAAGEGGTFIGSQGVSTSVDSWSLF